MLIFSSILLLSSIALLFYFFPVFGISLIWLSYLLDTLFFRTLPSLAVGGISVYFMDILAIPLFVAGIGRLGYSFHIRRRIDANKVFLLLWSAVLFFSFLRGVGAHGIVGAGNEFRTYFHFICVAVIAASLEPTGLRCSGLLKSWLRVAALIMLIALARWVLMPLGLFSPEEIGVEGLRVISAEQTLVLFQAFFILLSLQLIQQKSGKLHIFAYIIPFFLIFLQHRTVWMVALCSLLLLHLYEQQTRPFLRKIAIMTFIICNVALIPLLGGEIAGKMQHSIQEPTNTEDSTFAWRIEGWQSLIDLGSFSLSDYAIGQPFGKGYVRYINNQEVDVSPHNYFLQTLLRTGIVGLALLLLLYGGMIKKLLKYARARTDSTWIFRSLGILLIGELIFYLTYNPRYEQGILVGLALAALSSAPLIREVSK
ncbi:MAG TPA: hypothetical protein DD435_05780 [Cyanobacteria bacterium UBA8530]|nr:hypothetical protein [Cyanobacteria bacterium UBA8530]